jgi:hypothetical protein
MFALHLHAIDASHGAADAGALSGHRKTAADRQCLPRYKAGFIRTEECDRGGNIIRLTDPPHRNSTDH